jgi:hypothetical protein
MARGWIEHIPFTYLTDSFCNPGNSMKVQNKNFEFDQQLGHLIPAEQPLNKMSEDRLTFEDWHAGGHHFLELIDCYIPHIHKYWKTHFECIWDAPDLLSNWPTWLAYDITLRKQSLHNGINPATFHQDLWYCLKIDMVTSIPPQPSSSHQSNHAHQLSNQSTSNSSFHTLDCYTPYQENKSHPQQTK